LLFGKRAILKKNRAKRGARGGYTRAELPNFRLCFNDLAEATGRSYRICAALEAGKNGGDQAPISRGIFC
jgi:hypothetical protein